ncbi:MAG TPA: protein-disulfide reductase DsbD domain-containing protein, partial [Sphingomicrobium sp.]|nr:protein-disulfide reductase DsbD domain-containing protein [Sphingomicrobium sp.]
MRKFFLLFLLIAWPALLQARGIEPQLLAEGPAPAGGEVELAIHMRPEPGWHGYWLNPGDAGLPMDVEWHLPKGFSAGPLRYPAPTRLTIAGLMNYVFERDYAVLVRLKVPSSASGIVPIRADARWLACTEKICVPEKGTLAIDLPVGSGTPNRNEFDAWRQELAQPLATPGHFAADGSKLHVAIPLPSNVEIRDPYLFPVTDRVVDYEAPQKFRRSGDWLVADLSMKQVPSQFEGVLASSGGRALEFRALPGPVPQGGTPLGGLGWNAILLAVLGAIAGGILLNLMPCVFPILALKALHISRAGGEARAARIDSFSYVAGTIIGTGALGAILTAIRAAGAEAGWAFQLQDPRTIMLLFLLASAITANLLGLFELPVLGGRLQTAGS